MANKQPNPSADRAAAVLLATVAGRIVNANLYDNIVDPGDVNGGDDFDGAVATTMTNGNRSDGSLFVFCHGPCSDQQTDAFHLAAGAGQSVPHWKFDQYGRILQFAHKCLRLKPLRLLNEYAGSE